MDSLERRGGEAGKQSVSQARLRGLRPAPEFLAEFGADQDLAVLKGSSTLRSQAVAIVNAATAAPPATIDYGPVKTWLREMVALALVGSEGFADSWRERSQALGDDGKRAVVAFLNHKGGFSFLHEGESASYFVKVDRYDQNKIFPDNGVEPTVSVHSVDGLSSISEDIPLYDVLKNLPHDILE